MEEKCSNCRNRKEKPMWHYDYCPVLDTQVSKDDDIYSMCCDYFEEDI